MKPLWGAALVVLTAAALAGQIGVLRTPNLSGDLLTTYAIRAYARDAYAGRAAEQWNPLLQAGYPFHAESEGALLYPVHLLLSVWLPPERLLPAGAVLHLAAMAFFTYLFARRRGISVEGAVLAGIVFAGSGYFVRHHGHEWSYRTGAWFPLVLYLVHRIVAERDRRWGPLLALAVGCQWLAGHYNLAYWTALAAGAYGFVAAARPEAARARRWGDLAVAAAAFAAGLALAAVQILPTAELAPLSHRAEGVGLQPWAAYSLWPVHLSRFLFPRVAVDLPGTANGNETDVYVGVFALALAAVGAAAAWRGGSRDLVWMLTGSFVLVLGVFFPPNLLLYVGLPGYAAFRGPVRAIFLVSFFLAVLAGKGLDAAREAPLARRRLWARRLGLAVLAAALALWTVGRLAGPLGDAVARALHAAAEAWGRPRSPDVHAGNLRGYLAQVAGNARPGAAAFLWPLAWGALACAWLAAGRAAGAWRPRAAAALLLAAADAGFYARGHMPYRLADARVPRPFAAEIAFLKRDSEPFRIFCWPRAAHAVDGIRFPGTYYFQLHGIANAASTTPRLGAIARIPILWRASGHAFAPEELYKALDVLGLLGVKYVLSDGPLRDPRLTEAFRERLWVYRNAAYAGRVRAADPTTGAALPPEAASARILADTGSRVVIEADLARPALLVLADNDVPAWRAEVDGAPVARAPLPPGTPIGRAVRLPAGRHRVEWIYASPADRRGLAASAAAAAAIAAWLAAVFIRRGRMPADPVCRA